MAYTIGALPLPQTRRTAVNAALRPVAADRLSRMAPGATQAPEAPEATAQAGDELSTKPNTAVIVGGIAGLALLAYVMFR